MYTCIIVRTKTSYHHRHINNFRINSDSIVDSGVFMTTKEQQLTAAAQELNHVYKLSDTPEKGVRVLHNRTNIRAKIKLVKPHAVATISGMQTHRILNGQTVRKDTLLYVMMYKEHPFSTGKKLRQERMAAIHRLFSEKTPYKLTHADMLRELKQEIKDLKQEVKDLKKSLQEMQTKGW